MKLALSVLVLLTGCAHVHQSDVDAWSGVPVGALDTHSLFITLPMIRTVSPEGIEIRNYPNKKAVGRCLGYAQPGMTGASSYASYMAFSNCNSELKGCDNIFYIKDGKVVEYLPKGKCYTDKTTRPEARYERLKG